MYNIAGKRASLKEELVSYHDESQRSKNNISNLQTNIRIEDNQSNYLGLGNNLTNTE